MKCASGHRYLAGEGPVSGFHPVPVRANNLSSGVHKHALKKQDKGK